jgi:hypothetical protein
MVSTWKNCPHVSRYYVRTHSKRAGILGQEGGNLTHYISNLESEMLIILWRIAWIDVCMQRCICMYVCTYASEAVNKLAVRTAFCIAVSEVTNYKVGLVWKCVENAKMFFDIDELQKAGVTNFPAKSLLRPGCLFSSSNSCWRGCTRNTLGQLTEQTVD